MSGFPTVKPAFTILVEIAAPQAVGSASRGTPLHVVPMTGGSVRSHEEYSLKVDAKMESVGNDYIRIDPDQKRMRLDAHAIAKNQSGALFYLNYKGVVDITEGVAKILSGAPDMATTEFGNSFIEMRFETGDSELKELESHVYVGAGRFVVEQGKPVTVEYRVSQVTWAK